MVRKLTTMMCAGVLLGGCAAQSAGTPQGHGRGEMRVDAEAVAGWRADGEWLVSPALEAPQGASRVGVFLGMSQPIGMPRLQARAVIDGAPSGEWVDVEQTWSEEDHFVGIAELGAVADGAELRITAQGAPLLSHLRWNAVIPDDEAELAPGEEPIDELGASRQALRSELSAMGVISRSEWGARATRCSSRDTNKYRLAVHYTVTPSSDPGRQVRGIQRYHMDSRGWCDVGYHFLVGIDGSIYEGRPLDLRGAHVGGHNTGNIGVSFIGCFNDTGCSRMGPITPPDVMVNAGANLLGRLASLYGITVSPSTLKGHRDHAGASTSCPGSELYARLDDIRRIAASGGSTPPPPPPPEPTPTPTPGASCSHTAGGTYGHTACSAGYQCCDGRWRVRGSSRACGACACVESTGTVGCTGATSPTPTPTPSGASCEHSYGGTYADTACSAGYQCCDGRWTVRGSSASCGACLCEETSGRTGCTSAGSSPPAPTPPPGASCEHTYGGTYANTACSAGYQCCDGRWRVRGSSSSCGACFCEETTGSTGCGT